MEGNELLGEEREREFLPQPQFGTGDGEGLELTKYHTEDKPFIYPAMASHDDNLVISGEIPPKIKNFFWGFLNKNLTLSNLSDADIRVLMDRYDQAEDIFIMSIPRGEFNFSTMRHLNNCRTLVHVKACRAKRGFERSMERSQISQSMYGPMNQHEGQGRPGLFGTLFGR